MIVLLASAALADTLTLSYEQALELASEKNPTVLGARQDVRVAEGALLAASRERHQAVAGEGLTWMFKKYLKHRELPRSERQNLAILLQAAGCQIDLDIAKSDGSVFGSRCPRHCFGLSSKNGLYAGNEFPRVEWFGKIIVGTHFESNDAIDLITPGGEHDNGLLRLVCPQTPADRKPVFARHHQIEHDQVKGAARQQSVHHNGIICRLDDKALFREIALKEVTQSLVVIDNQYLSFRHMEIVTGKGALWDRRELYANASERPCGNKFLQLAQIGVTPCCDWPVHC